MNADTVLIILRQHLPSLKRKYPIGSLALFGSVARGENTKTSDVDILVEITGFMGFGFVDLGDELAAILGQRVDLISRRGLKPRAWEVIQKDLVYV